MSPVNIHRSCYCAVLIGLISLAILADENSNQRKYKNQLTPIRNPRPILADYPEFVAPVGDTVRYEAPILVDDKNADLEVRAWRFSFNARGIIEIPNRLRADRTAIIVVHPWGIDDGQGWRTPEPVGVAFFCTPQKNRLYHEHLRKVINPFLKSLRGKVGFVMYSEPGHKDAIRSKLYRSIHSGPPNEEQRRQGVVKLSEKLNRFSYKGATLPSELTLSADRPVADYFRQFPGLAWRAPYNHNPPGFFDLPVPVARMIDVHPQDVVIYDDEGYDPLRDFLKQHGIRHILLTGYATDYCYRTTTAGYNNLSRDFNVFLVGDATMATFPANDSPRHATNAAISLASRDHLITQISWIGYIGKEQAGH